MRYKMALRAFASIDCAMRDGLRAIRNAGTALEPGVWAATAGGDHRIASRRRGDWASPFFLARLSAAMPVLLKGYVTEIGPKSSPARHAYTAPFAHSHTIMRGAFVVQLGPETKPAKGQFEGSVHEVDSCTELRFHSTEELLKFMGQCFDLAMASADKTGEQSRGEQALGKRRAGRASKVRETTREI